MIVFLIGLVYVIGFGITTFGCYYSDYKTAASEFWCTGHDGAARFASQFIGFHLLIGAFWPVAVPLFGLAYILKGVGWCISKGIGGTLASVAERFSK